uniref:Uncharacterized protein n=1 Tax=Setaria viridis TaxID=4556 RepID=A0A4V6D4Y3_SETVI|nr:hypothetical protein SEVIR_6G019000v2 [Setaria viridis]
MGAVTDHVVETLLEVRSSPWSETEWIAILHRNMLNMHTTRRIMGLGPGQDWQVRYHTCRRKQYKCREKWCRPLAPLICFCPRLPPVGVLHSFRVVDCRGSHSPDA